MLIELLFSAAVIVLVPLVIGAIGIAAGWLAGLSPDLAKKYTHTRETYSSIRGNISSHMGHTGQKE